MITQKIYFTKIREVKTPCRANPTDAGIDFFMPKVDEEFKEALMAKNKHNCREYCPLDYSRPDVIKLYPGCRVTIPTGIRVRMAFKNTALIGFNKSGLSANKGIIVTAQVVDYDYTGEVHVGLLNTSDVLVVFKEGDKIGQFVHVPIFLSEMEEVDGNEYARITSDSERGDGGFGSTDKK